ncbi:MAG: rhodanese-like domain-containing protein [Caldilineaceae bacterium]|nr:rhodanese-like domain-containing protein [Caldilineaceae bacterium]
MIFIVVVILVIAIVAWYVTVNQKNQSAITPHQRLTPQQYQTTYAPRRHLLVDVRSPEEFASGHIPGAVNIALPTLPQQMATLPKDRPIVLYCRSGARSSSAAQMLSKGGFDNVHDLGGLIDWRAQGMPVS